MSELDIVSSVLSGGGVLAFAYVVWRGLTRIENKLERLVERVVRIDERTFSAEMRAEQEQQAVPQHVKEQPTGRIRRPRSRTPLAGVRAKPQTPFMGGDEDT